MHANLSINRTIYRMPGIEMLNRKFVLLMSIYFTEIPNSCDKKSNFLDFYKRVASCKYSLNYELDGVKWLILHVYYLLL